MPVFYVHKGHSDHYVVKPEQEFLESRATGLATGQRPWWNVWTPIDAADAEDAKVKAAEQLQHIQHW